MRIQHIGVDIGKEYTKCYTDFKGKIEYKRFKSIVGEYTSNLNLYEESVAVEVNNKKWLAGEQAKKVCKVVLVNSSNKSFDLTSKLLFYCALSEIVVSNRVKVLIEVSNNYKKESFKEIQNDYKGKTLSIKDIKNNIDKEILIEDIIVDYA